MPLRVRCECGESLTVPENKAGMQVLCPLCNRQVTIPPRRSASPPPPPPPPPVVKPTPSRPMAAKPASGDGPSQAKRPQPRDAAPRQPPAPPPAPATPPPRKSRKGKTASDGAKPQAAKKDVAKPTAAPPPLPSARSRGDDAKPAAVEKSAVSKSAVRKSDSAIPPPVAPSAPVRAPQPAKPQAADKSKTPPPVPPPARDTAAAKKEASVAPEPKEESLPGVEHDPGKKWTVYQLGMAVAALGLAGMYPSIAEVIRHVTDFDSTGVEAWAYFVFLLTAIQLVYALYLVQLPDWSTLWVVMILCACVTVFYAMVMGISMMAGKDNALLAALGLTASHQTGYLSLWCLMMMMLTSLLTYALVRASVKWQKSFELAMAGREG